jgi:hypothetical protein
MQNVNKFSTGLSKHENLPCGPECHAELGVSTIRLETLLVYDSVYASAPLYHNLSITYHEDDYLLKFVNMTKTEYGLHGNILVEEKEYRIDDEQSGVSVFLSHEIGSIEPLREIKIVTYIT